MIKRLSTLGWGNIVDVAISCKWLLVRNSALTGRKISGLIVQKQNRTFDEKLNEPNPGRGSSGSELDYECI
jgi:hypothetical protein